MDFGASAGLFAVKPDFPRNREAECRVEESGNV
jgi:hypothetical protein